MQNTKLMHPMFLDKVVLIDRQEYDRMFKENVELKVMQAKLAIAEGKVLTHEEVMAGLDKLLAELKQEQPNEV